MPVSTKKETKVNNFTAEQERLLSSVQSMLKHAMTTKDESDFFETSSELFRIVATAVKRSEFIKSDSSNIDYDKQVLEFCVDTLSEQVYGDDIVKYDN